MSYILDALKRAERERKQGQGQVSVLDEIPNTPVAEPRRRLPPQLIAPIAGFVVLAILVYGGMAWRRHALSGAPPQPSVAAAPPVAVPPPPTPAVVQPPPPQAPTATIEDGSKLATLDDIQAPSPPGTPPAVPPSDAGPQISVPHGLPLAAALPAPQSPAPQRTPAAAQGAKTGAADVQLDQAAATSESTPQETPPPVAHDQGSVTRRQLHEMPESFRANFPTFTVDVHAYNIDPVRRFVLINGKRYHEGDTLAEGPRIIGIVPEGIVFDWQGQQVLYAIAH